MTYLRPVKAQRAGREMAVRRCGCACACVYLRVKSRQIRPEVPRSLLARKVRCGVGLRVRDQLLLHRQLRAGRVQLAAVRAVDGLAVGAAQAGRDARPLGASNRRTSSPASPASARPARLSGTCQVCCWSVPTVWSGRCPPMQWIRSARVHAARTS
jgi:hypothetical protein